MQADAGRPVANAPPHWMMGGRERRRITVWLGAALSLLLHVGVIVALVWQVSEGRVAPIGPSPPTPVVVLQLEPRPAVARSPARDLNPAVQKQPMARDAARIRPSPTAGPQPTAAPSASGDAAAQWRQMFRTDPPNCPREDVALMAPAARIYCLRAAPRSTGLPAPRKGLAHDPLSQTIAAGGFKDAVKGATDDCAAERKATESTTDPAWRLKPDCKP